MAGVYFINLKKEKMFKRYLRCNLFKNNISIFYSNVNNIIEFYNCFAIINDNDFNVSINIYKGSLNELSRDDIYNYCRKNKRIFKKFLRYEKCKKDCSYCTLKDSHKFIKIFKDNLWTYYGEVYYEKSDFLDIEKTIIENQNYKIQSLNISEKEKREIEKKIYENSLKYKNKKGEPCKYKESVDFRIRQCLDSRIRQVLKRNREHKSNKTFEILGCNFETLKNHLESQFVDGMTWENQGKYGWHIDHIIPCASFDLTNPEEQKKCFHYTNLQPLWARDNWSKGAKLKTT